jgi:hypothetical protein
MTASSHPGPDDHDSRDGLSARERRVLSGIENHLSADDPRLARLLAERRSAASAHRVRWWPMSLRCTVLLLVVLALLAVAAAVVPPSWWVLLGVITTVVVVPWLLFCVTENRASR